MMRHTQSTMALAIGMALVTTTIADAKEISIQSFYPPLQFEGALPGGAHPIGGASKAFVDHANAMLEPFDLSFKMHVSGGINSFDEGTVGAPLVNRRDWDGSLHNAVAAGPEAGGLTAALGIPANSGLAFGEYYSGGVPFGFTADEFMTFLLSGGGLELQQRFYDEAFDGKLKVLPIALTAAQGSGFFGEPIPEPNDTLDANGALAAFCQRPIIVRYPGGAAAILQDACQSVGEQVDLIGRATRCEDANAQCGPGNADNPVVNEPQRLTIGGFAPGVVPHTMYANGNIDAYELNMPTEHVQLLKMVAGLAGEPNDTADISAVTPPYHYGTSWHQPWLYAELIFNRDAWDNLTDQEQALIELAARSALVTTFAERAAAQGEAMDILEKNGATHLSWPPAMIEQLAGVADQALDRVAAKNASEGDTTLQEMLAAMRTYADAQQAFFDYDDINQGRSNTPSQP